MPNLIPAVPGIENPAAAVVAVVPITGNFAPRARPVDAVLEAVVATLVAANPDNVPIRGVAELLAAVGRPRENPVLVGIAVANLGPPPRDNPLVVVAAGVTPRVSPELGLLPALIPANPVEAVGAAAVPPPSVNAGVGVATAAVLFVPSVNPCDGVDPKVNPLG